MSTETKTVYFFGNTESTYTTTRIEIGYDECKQLATTFKLPDDTPLQRLNTTTFGTRKQTSAYYFWTGTSYSTVINYYITLHKIIKNRQGMISVTGLEPRTACEIDIGSCEMQDYFLVWGEGYKKYTPDKPCKNYANPNETCVISTENIFCPKLGIVIVPYFKPYACGRPIGIIRLIVTTNRQDWNFVKPAGYIPINLEFQELATTSRELPSGDTFLGVQVDQCNR